MINRRDTVERVEGEGGRSDFVPGGGRFDLALDAGELAQGVVSEVGPLVGHGVAAVADLCHLRHAVHIIKRVIVLKVVRSSGCRGETRAVIGSVVDGSENHAGDSGSPIVVHRQWTTNSIIGVRVGAIRVGGIGELAADIVGVAGRSADAAGLGARCIPLELRDVDAGDWAAIEGDCPRAAIGTGDGDVATADGGEGFQGGIDGGVAGVVGDGGRGLAPKSETESAVGGMGEGDDLDFVLPRLARIA